MTRWPDGRGAIALGGDSAWGDWVSMPHGEDMLALDDDEIYYGEDGIEYADRMEAIARTA